MTQIQDWLVRYGDWMEKRPKQAMFAHIGIYIAVSALVIGLGLSVAA